MSLNNTIKVPMPGQKVFIKRVKSHEYVYYRTRIYRNEKGQPTSDTAIIGKRDLESGMLIPNSRYYEIFDETPSVNQSAPKTIKDYGNTFLLDFLMAKYDILSTLKYAFPQNYLEIATLAEYMVCEGNVFYYCDDWCEKTFTKLEKVISSQACSRIFESIDYDSKMKFFRRWVYAREKEEYLAYDVTSISSYSTGNDNVEWGYNRDNENLPQVNMGMIFGETSKIPVYYNVYPGSIPDKCYLDYMLSDSNLLGLKYSKFVMDKGFFTADNLNRLVKETLRFIVSVPNSQNIPKRIISENQHMQYDSKNSLGFGKPYAKCVTINDYGFRANLHIFFDSLKFHLESDSLYNEIEKREKALLSMKFKPSVDSAYDKYFTFFDDKNGSFTFERNPDVINNSISHLGYFLLLTTDFALSSQEVLDIYRRKDIIEKSFDNLKNALDMKRIRTHNKDTCDGKMFVAFIALILKSILDFSLREFNRKNNMTVDKVIKELSKIRLVSFDNGTSLLNPITKKQKDILDIFAICSDHVVDSIR